MRKMGPLSADHPLVTDKEKCAACREPFVGGEYVTLVPIGPGDDKEARIKAGRGEAYNGVAVAAHWECVVGAEPTSSER